MAHSASIFARVKVSGLVLAPAAMQSSGWEYGTSNLPTVIPSTDCQEKERLSFLTIKTISSHELKEFACVYGVEDINLEMSVSASGRKALASSGTTCGNNTKSAWS